MDLEELKRLIRSTLKKKIREASIKERSPALSFSDFRRRFAEALERSGVPSYLVEEARDINSSGHVFDSIYGAWQDIQTEMSYSHLSFVRETWNDSVSFHVKKAVLDMMSVHMNPQSDDYCYEGSDLDPSELSEKVTQYFRI